MSLEDCLLTFPSGTGSFIKSLAKSAGTLPTSAALGRAAAETRQLQSKSGFQSQRPLHGPCAQQTFCFQEPARPSSLHHSHLPPAAEGWVQVPWEVSPAVRAGERGCLRCSLLQLGLILLPLQHSQAPPAWGKETRGAIGEGPDSVGCRAHSALTEEAQRSRAESTLPHYPE